MSQEVRRVLAAQWDLGLQAAKALEAWMLQPEGTVPVASAAGPGWDTDTEMSPEEELQFRRDEVGALRVLLLRAWEKNRELMEMLSADSSQRESSRAPATLGPVFVPAEFSSPLHWMVHPATLHPKAPDPAPEQGEGKPA